MRENDPTLERPASARSDFREPSSTTNLSLATADAAAQGLAAGEVAAATERSWLLAVEPPRLNVKRDFILSKRERFRGC